MPFLSIIVPIYNAEKYLKECLDSIVQQTYRDYELILVNDGSTDKSFQICRSYAEQYRNIQIVNKENGGLVSARKAGLARACGEYIGWVDSDDCIDSMMFEKMCDEAKQKNVDIVVCDIWSWSGDKLIPMEQAIQGGGVYFGQKLENDFYSQMLYARRFYSFGILPAQVNKIVKSSIIRKNMEKVDDNIKIGEDAACTYFCMLDASSISYLKGDFLYKYRTNFGSMCFQWKQEKVTSASSLLNYLYTRLSEYDIPQVKEQFWYYFVCIYTNVYFEYGIFACANHQKVRFIKKGIELDSSLKREFALQMQNKTLNLPWDRKLLIEAVLCGKKAKKLPALAMLKLRCFLMLVYRQYKGSRYG